MTARFRFNPETVFCSIELDDRGFYFTADTATWDATTGELVSVQIGNRDVSAAAIEAVFGPISALAADVLDDLLRDARDDAECDWADWQNDMRKGN